MIIPRSSTETLITALRVLAHDLDNVRGEDSSGVVSATIREAADRMEEMQRQLERIPVADPSL